jgi:Tol biopolymer transport system component
VNRHAKAPSAGSTIRQAAGLGCLVALVLAIVLVLGTPVADAVAPPLVYPGGYGADPAGGVDIRGFINPQNSAVTDCNFDYGLTTGYGQTAPCAQAIPADEELHIVTAHIASLKPGATYHFKLSATGAGSAETPDQQFIAPSPPAPPTCTNEALREAEHATFLPDCRAYEQVSPVNKNGGDILLASSHTRAAFGNPAGDSNALSFASLVGFGDAEGMAIAADYIAERDPTTGWSTHAITPVQEPTSGALVVNGPGFPAYEGDFSPDLSKGVTRTYLSPALPTTPNTEKVENLYLRDNLLTPGSGHYRLVTDSSNPLQQFGLSYKPRYAGASADFSHVLFESNKELTTDAPANENPKLYEMVLGAVRYLGYIPVSGDSCVGLEPQCVPAESSLAGQGASNEQYTPRVISSDGSRVFFTVPAATDPSGTTQLYVRDTHGTVTSADDTTVRISASEKPISDPPQEATYQDASDDGRYVFFTTAEQLIAADTNTVTDLYRYDADAPAAEHLTLVSMDAESADAPAKVEGALGASEDGSYVYFLAQGQLVSGAPISPNSGRPFQSIYLWHNGTIFYVGSWPSENIASVYEAVGTTGWRGGNPKTSRVSPDGQHLLFSSFRGEVLTGYDHGTCAGFEPTCRELYVYDAATSTPTSPDLACASCNPSGAPATANAADNTEVNTGAQLPTWHQSRALSADGRYVFFSTADHIVKTDTNGVSDAYGYDTQTAQVHLLSSGTDPNDSYFLESGINGHDAFFATRARLVNQDIDNNFDVYDARVQGGIAAQNPPPGTGPCASTETCHGAAPVTPGAITPGSAILIAPGNQKQPRPCRKTQIRRHGHCVKKPKKQHSKRSSKRTASHNRGGQK